MNNPGPTEQYCPDCGEIILRKAEICPECGVRQSNPGGDFPTPGSSRDTHFYIGAVITAVCVIILPFFLILVAIPESIMSFWGRSIQDSIDGGKDNAYLSGSFLILRWFGNFCLFVIVIGAAALLLLMA